MTAYTAVYVHADARTTGSTPAVAFHLTASSSRAGVTSWRRREVTRKLGLLREAKRHEENEEDVSKKDFAEEALKEEVLEEELGLNIGETAVDLRAQYEIEMR